MLASTSQRVPVNTAEDVNARIRRETEETVRRVAAAGSGAIERRLRELDREWDVERYVETMAPTFTLIGMGLGLTVSKKWFVLPFVVHTADGREYNVPTHVTANGFVFGEVWKTGFRSESPPNFITWSQNS